MKREGKKRGGGEYDPISSDFLSEIYNIQGQMVANKAKPSQQGKAAIHV